MTLEPGFQTFSGTYEAGRAQVVWTRLIDDLETPVSAYLKVGNGRPYAFLFESVEGGAWRGRYSVIALKPDLVWRCRGEVAEIAEGEDIAAGRFTTQTGGALDSLRDLVAASRLDLPPGLPPMTAGVFGAVGYDMVRLVERLPKVNPDTLGLPDAVMIRPSVVAVFDGIAQEILLATTVRPSAQSAEQAWAAAAARLEAVRIDIATPTPQPKGGATPEPDRFTTPVSREDYRTVVDRAKGYIAAGDIFQVVPSHRFRAPFPHDPFALYRSLRRTNPSPFLFYLNFGDFQLAGSSPEILVRLRDGKITIRPIAGTRPRGATPEEDQALEAELRADPKERAEHLMLLDLGRNDVGRVAMLNAAGANAPLARSAAVRPENASTTVIWSRVGSRLSSAMAWSLKVTWNMPGMLDAAGPVANRKALRTPRGRPSSQPTGFGSPPGRRRNPPLSHSRGRADPRRPGKAPSGMWRSPAPCSRAGAGAPCPPRG